MFNQSEAQKSVQSPNYNLPELNRRKLQDFNIAAITGCFNYYDHSLPSQQASIKLCLNEEYKDCDLVINQSAAKLELIVKYQGKAICSFKIAIATSDFPALDPNSKVMLADKSDIKTEKGYEGNGLAIGLAIFADKLAINWLNDFISDKTSHFLAIHFDYAHGAEESEPSNDSYRQHWTGNQLKLLGYTNNKEVVANIIKGSIIETLGADMDFWVKILR